jgi:hypothetical protein
VKIKMVRDTNTADHEHLLATRMKVMQEIDPFTSPAAELQWHHVEFDRQVMEEQLGKV